jgi:ribosomal protein L11 methyltransferase
MTDEPTDDAQGVVLTLQLPPGEAGSAQGFIREAFRVEPVLIECPETFRSWLEVYLPSDLNALLVSTAVRNRWPKTASSIQPLQSRDWQTFWRHHFHPISIGQRLEVIPAWEAAPHERAGGERIRLLINPGLSFGTGGHFTTRFCLEALERLAGAGRGGSLLDVGTGSGILAIAAVRLGYHPVTAIDVDEQALGRARENARLNGVESGVRFEHSDIRAGRIERPYAVVIANLFSSLLTDAAPALRRLCSRFLVVSGIRDEETDEVAEAFLALGARERIRDGNGEWSGMVLGFGEETGPSGEPGSGPAPKGAK